MIQEINAIGWTGTFFSILNLLPQVVDAFIRGNIDGVSTVTVLAFFIGNFFWITYGVGINSAQVIVSSTIQLIAASVLLWFRYGNDVKSFFRPRKNNLIV